MSENWEQDERGLWWKVAQAEGGVVREGPFDNDYVRIPTETREIVELLRQVALNCDTAGLTTIDSESGCPHSRTVSTRTYVSEDFVSATIATRAQTRKCADIRSSEKASFFWKDNSGKGGWVCAQGVAEVIPDTTDAEKAKIKVTFCKLEAQDYNLRIMGDINDTWKPCVLVRSQEGWRKVQ
eukprot:TRINITY_DN114474_c0_g1_i1.p1 TRINITY_DN114474_c0_g1~~TRINITY_DN114474_c0_g1_i1.p1  ORF type:complete len:182 (-),score=22.74 TRINITY_DN114474_c0_g1_i1:133-678(-)